MLLAIDIGNTHTVLGLYRDKELWENWRITSDQAKTEDEYAMILSNLLGSSGHGMNEVKAMVISSTVPPLQDMWHLLALKYFNFHPLMVDGQTKTNLKILLDNPNEIGPDRIANGVAGVAKHGTALIIVDLGTATTFECISEAGEYMGGVIAPGIGISANALFDKTSRLPRVEFKVPKQVLAPNTIGALQSGLIYGFAGQIDGIVTRLKKELQQDTETKYKVIATGGMAQIIADVSETIDLVDPLLTLDGLNIIFRLSIGKS